MSEQALTLPPPASFALEAMPGISPDLIRERMLAGDEAYLISLFDHIQRSKHRAEALAQAYFNQMEVLHKRLMEARGESGGTRGQTAGAEPKPTTALAPRSKPKPEKPAVEIVI
jgi:hypothetical protein